MHAKTDLLLTHIRRGTEEYRTQIVAEACFLPIGTREEGMISSPRSQYFTQRALVTDVRPSLRFDAVGRAMRKPKKVNQFALQAFNHGEALRLVPSLKTIHPAISCPSY